MIKNDTSEIKYWVPKNDLKRPKIDPKLAKNDLRNDNSDGK